jgi:hypothetical protein
MKLLTLVVLFGMVTLGSTMMTANDDTATTTNTEAEIEELEQLHAAFHRAASVHNIVTGDSAAEIAIRIRQILSLWTKDAVLQLDAGSPFDGYYRGKGNPDDSSTCPMPSGNPRNQGTLCTFYTYVAGSFQPENIFISLTPAYKEHYKVSGDSATFYFECHYFNVATDPTTSAPLWEAVSHVALTGTARKINGEWKFWHAVAPKVAVPVP